MLSIYLSLYFCQFLAILHISILFICLFLLKHTCTTRLFIHCSVSGNVNHGTQRVFFRINKNWFRRSYWREHRRVGVLNHRWNCFMEGKISGIWWFILNYNDSYWISLPVNKIENASWTLRHTLSRKKITFIFKKITCMIFYLK